MVHLRWNASNIEAGAAQGSPAFHAGHLEAQLCSFDCCDIASWATSDDDDVLPADEVKVKRHLSADHKLID